MTRLPVRRAGVKKARQVCNRLAVVLAGLERPLDQISGGTPVSPPPPSTRPTKRSLSANQP